MNNPMLVDDRFLSSLARGDRGLRERLVRLQNQFKTMTVITDELLRGRGAGFLGNCLKEAGISELFVTLPTRQGLRNLLSFLAKGQKLDIFFTGCPDYSTRDGHYSFESMGEGVSLLPRIQLVVAYELARILWEFGVDFECHLLIADLAEGTDPIVARKFCNGDISEFLRRCASTVKRLKWLAENCLPLYLQSYFDIGSFSSYYGERYTQIQQEYLNLVLRKRQEDAAFGQAFLSTHVKRIDLYRRFLAGYDGDPSPETLEYRTARGIAQYLAHFSLIRLENEAPVIVNHRTISLQWVNRSDLYLTNEERRVLSQKLQTPLFVIENKVY